MSTSPIPLAGLPLTGRLLLLPLALVVALAACETSPAPDGPDGTPRPQADGPLPDTAMVRVVTLGSTADLIGGDLNAVSPSVAIQTLDLWIARLDTVSTDGVSDVRADLTTLRNQLQSNPLDGRAIGETLRELGDGTEPLAEPGSDLARLSRMLRAAGDRLAPDTTETATGQSAS